LDIPRELNPDGLALKANNNLLLKDILKAFGNKWVFDFREGLSVRTFG